MKSDYDYYEGKCIDEKTYEKEKKKYGLSEDFVEYWDGFPSSRCTFTRVGNKVEYQVADLGMGRAKSTTYSFDSEGEAMAWMIYKMKTYQDSAKQNKHVEIR